MLAAALVLFLPRQAEVATYELYRGARLANREIGYWDVTDTYLDAQQPDVNYGGNGVVLGGPGKTILVKFGDLRRALGANKVVDAKLVLSPSGGQVPELKAISRVTAPWGEGPVNTLMSVIQANAAKNDPTKPQAPVWSSTWRTRRSGTPGVAWQNPGGDMERIEGAKFTAAETTVTIDGLAATVQRMLDRPYENHGFAVTFSNPTEFFSSQAPIGRPRLVVTIAGQEPVKGPDLSVVSISRLTASGALPKDGDEAIYTARIKNVGDSPSKGFTARWVIGEREGATIDIPQALAPGAETTISTKRPYKFNSDDHRVQPIALKLNPPTPDASAANDYLEVQESALTIEVAASNGNEDAIQEHVRFLNEVAFPQSRFSFAREGALERIAVQSIQPQSSNGATADARVSLTGELRSGTLNGEFLRALGRAAGLPDLAPTNLAPGERNDLVNRGSLDVAPGFMGYGDTRFEGTVSGLSPLLYEPFSSPLLDIQPLEPTGLLSATDVAVLNQRLSRTRSTEDVLNKMPATVLLKALDIVGRPLPSMELSFFQLKDGKLSDEPPVFTVVTDTRGSAVLPTREGGVFGRVGSDGKNGVFLVRASSNGITEWGWLKAWQLLDSMNRAGTGAAFFEMRFNLPGAPVDTTADLALDRIVTDSESSPPAKTAALVDGNNDTMVELGGKGAWFEIDLGRDRTLAEIDLIANPDEMWRKFDIQIYATGQSPSGATMWAKEVDWKWTASNRRDLAGQVPVVAYRGLPLRVRFIRITNKTDQPGKLRGIKIVPARVSN